MFQRFVLPLLVAVVVFAVLFCAARQLPLTWDEGDAFKRADKINAWFTETLQGRLDKPFSQKSINAYWFHTNRLEGHPAGYTIVISAGRSIAELFPKGIFSEKMSYRLGDILLFAIAVFAVFDRLTRMKQLPTGTAFFSILAILCLPRVFAHLQIAACDSPLISAWLLAWALFWPAWEKKRFAVLWGIALGLGLSMKFTGWLIPLPFIAFACYRVVIDWYFSSSRIAGQTALKSAVVLSIALTTAVAVFILLNPSIWHDPIGGIQKFLYLNTHRRENFNIPIMFLGTVHTFSNPLPWYNAVFWFGITVPVGLILLGLLSLIGNRERSDVIVLTWANFLILLIVRSVPGTPMHDGVRLFVPAFAFWGILTGIGAALLWNFSWKTLWETTWKVRFSKSVCRLGITAVFLTCLFNLYWYSPQWLSFYNATIGGLRGATRSGMETTYYWDSFDQEVLDWLRKAYQEDLAESQAGISSPFQPEPLFFFCSPSIVRLYRQWGKLDAGKVSSEGNFYPGQFRRYVFQYRQGVVIPSQIHPLDGVKPVYRKTIRNGGWSIWNLGDTPLLEIYDARDFITVTIENGDNNN